MIYGEGNVLALGIVMWDGITRPDTKTDDKTKESFTTYSLKVALLKSSPEVAEIQGILSAELQNGEFKGKFPNGGHWGLTEVDPTSLEGRLPSHVAINPKSYRKVQVFDVNNQEIPEVAYQNLLYPGATVRVIVSARTFNNVSKGVGLWLGGIQIVDATTPRLPVGNGVDASKAFGSAPPPGGAPAPGGFAPGGYSAPGAPAPGGYAPGGAPGGFVPGAPAPGPAAPPPAAPAGPVMTAKAQGATYDQFRAQGWIDEALIAQGYMTAPVATPPAMPAAPAPGGYAPAGAPGGYAPGGAPGYAPAGVAPAPDFLNPATAGVPPMAPAGPVMTAKAQGATYDQFRAQGWTDEALRANGYMM